MLSGEILWNTKSGGATLTGKAKMASRELTIILSSKVSVNMRGVTNVIRVSTDLEISIGESLSVNVTS